jgi:hypothetical protein
VTQALKTYGMVVADNGGLNTLSLGKQLRSGANGTGDHTLNTGLGSILQTIQGVPQPQHRPFQAALILLRRVACFDHSSQQPQGVADLVLRGENRQAPFLPGPALAIAAAIVIRVTMGPLGGQAPIQKGSPVSGTTAVVGGGHASI